MLMVAQHSIDIASTYRSIGPFRRLTHILGLGLSTSSRCGFMHRYVCLTTGCCENSLSISRNPVDLRPRRARGPEERPPEGAYVLKEGNVDEHGTLAAPVHGRRQRGSRGHDTWSARLRSEEHTSELQSLRHLVC